MGTATRGVPEVCTDLVMQTDAMGSGVWYPGTIVFSDPQIDLASLQR